jgi:hypothetical protein
MSNSNYVDDQMDIYHNEDWNEDEDWIDDEAIRDCFKDSLGRKN